eukprot:28754-Pelagococcus_subviridis.AAC.1
MSRCVGTRATGCTARAILMALALFEKAKGALDCAFRVLRGSPRRRTVAQSVCAYVYAYTRTVVLSYFRTLKLVYNMPAYSPVHASSSSAPASPRASRVARRPSSVVPRPSPRLSPHFGRCFTSKVSNATYKSPPSSPKIS